MGLLRRLSGFVLLYILVVEEEVGGEEVGDEVGTALGPGDTAVLIPI